MKPLRMLLASSLAIALVSCANRKDPYNTANPIGSPDGDQAATAANTPNQPVNPTYDTPAAYEDSAAAPVNPDALAPTLPATPATGAATRSTTVHTVVAGDTLSGIANKYKVTMAAIKQANGMTKDTVVLGRKLQIPAH